MWLESSHATRSMPSRAGPCHPEAERLSLSGVLVPCYRRRVMTQISPAEDTTLADFPTPEDVRVAFADTWGDMGPAWNVTPSVARVHGYLLAAGGELTERDLREALGLSHRATSLALGELEQWRLVERVEDGSRPPRPGPPAVAWRVAGDRWRWFQRVAEERRAREADPLQPRLATCRQLADEAVAASPDSIEAVRLRDWLAEIQGLAALFDRALRALSRAETDEIARGFSVLARISDDTLDSLLRLFGSLPEDELAETLEAIARTSPRTARRVMSAANRIARLGR
jgi:DNA-binding transcriptional regulator GbsR (MarR family)